MEKISITCTGCGNACVMTATVENGKIVELKDYNCHRGVMCAEKIVAKNNPLRA